MKQSENLTDIQKAKLNLIRSKMKLLDDMLEISRPNEVVYPDTTVMADPLLKKAQALIVQSRPDEGIPLILDYLEQVDNDSDSAIYAKIYLAEAYRQKREYDKGISMLYEMLGNKKMGAKNRAFALNRMAALMNEKKPFDGNRRDSVSRYSRLCIKLSEKHHLTEYLALSQNELGDNYLKMNMPDSALLMVSEAAKNFLSINKVPQTINTYLNLSRIYFHMGKLEESKNTLLKALELGNIEENRNLFMYVYYQLADRSTGTGDLNSAYEYLQVAYSLQSQFYDDRINQQINEMSARYDLQEKEAKIKEEAQRSRAYRLQLRNLLVISLITVGLLTVLVVLFRFKNRAYKKLVEQNLKALRLEKQVEFCLRNLSENDIMTRLATEDRNAELALRLEKFMAEEKPYLWSDVSLEEFCKKLNTNRSYLSKLINDKFNMGFYDFLFEYRIKSALEYLSNDQFSHLSVEGIGEMTGFKSISTFYKRFKNAVGMTPHQFRERVQKIKKPPLA
ncbi:MAG: helix-turn-helix domain-containing protein [Bacteroidales bacterium]